ncbi:MAG TPA: hypothetical protein VHO47_04415 [Candidatus Babeliales bacterium]|nr:hypothetical protein [Candidatus Babeliales bacterium]
MKFLFIIFFAIIFTINAAHVEKKINDPKTIYDDPAVLTEKSSGENPHPTYTEGGILQEASKTSRNSSGASVAQEATKKVISPRPLSPKSVADSIFVKKDKVERKSTAVPATPPITLSEEEMKNVSNEKRISKRINELELKNALLRKDWAGWNAWLHSDVKQKKQKWIELAAWNRMAVATKYLEKIEDDIQKWKDRKKQLKSVSAHALSPSEKEEKENYEKAAIILARPIEDRTPAEKDILLSIKKKHKVEESDFYDEFFKLQHKGLRVPPALLRDFVSNPLLVFHDKAINSDGQIEPDFTPLIDDNELEENEKIEKYKYSAPKRSTYKILGDFKNAVKKWENAYYEKEDQLISRQKNYEKFSDASKYMEIAIHDLKIKEIEEAHTKTIKDLDRVISTLAATNESLKKGVSPSSRRNGFLVGAASATTVCTLIGTFVWWKYKK